LLRKVWIRAKLLSSAFCDFSNICTTFNPRIPSITEISLPFITRAKFQRNIEEMLVSPIPNSLILWGYVLGGVARGIAVGILVIFVSLFFSKIEVYNLAITILVGFLTSLLFSLAGLLNGIFSKKFDDINIIPTFVLTPLTYLGGVFYSMSMLPEVWQQISRLNPIFYMVNAFRFGMLGQSDISIEVAITVIVGCIVLAYGLSIWLLNRGIGIKS